MLVALLALVLQEDAEATFRKFEKKYFEAKSVAVRFKFEITEEDEMVTSGDGHSRWKPGDKFVTQGTSTEHGKQRIEVAWKSDGRKVRGRANGVPQAESATVEGSSSVMACTLTRTGHGLTGLIMGAGAGKVRTPDELAKLKDFSLAEDGKNRVLSYTIATKDLGDIPVKLWLTPELVPRKRVVTLTLNGKKGRMTETYEDVSTEEIPDSEFEHRP